MRDKALGGGGNLKIKICLTIVTETKDDWCKEQKGYEKTESRMLISQHTRCGQVRGQNAWDKRGDHVRQADKQNGTGVQGNILRRTGVRTAQTGL